MIQEIPSWNPERNGCVDLSFIFRFCGYIEQHNHIFFFYKKKPVITTNCDTKS